MSAIASNTSLRILFINSIQMFGGGEIWMLTAMQGLRNCGHQIGLICRPGTELEERSKKLNFPTRIFPPAELESQTMKFTRTLSKRLDSFLFLMKSTFNIMNNKFIERWFDLEDECGAIAYQKKSQKELDDIVKDLYKKYP